MKVLKDLEQGSEAWFKERLCCVTGSKCGDVFGTPLARVQLIAELIAEEGTEATKMQRATPEMERGTYEEAFALKKFEEKTGKVIEKVGICIHDKYPWLKCSPDALIPDDKGEYTEAVEVKSPDSKTAIFYKMTNEIGMESLALGSYSAITKNNPVSVFKPSSKAPFLGIPAEYKWQVVNYFIVNEKLQKLYFVVYDARFIDEEQKLTITEVNRSDIEMQQALQEADFELERFRRDWMEWRDVILPNNF